MKKSINFESKRIAVYPRIESVRVGQNSYVEDFCQNLEQLGNIIVNKPVKTNPLFSLGLQINRADVFIFHWLENVPVYKRGFLQYIYAILLIAGLRLMGKQIIWFCHNKKVHGLKNKVQGILANHLCYILKKYSTIIFTHSKEGLVILEKYKKKTFYFIHPTKNKFVEKKFHKEYDLLIWGSISRYKGVLEFLNFVKSNSCFSDIKIKIVGLCTDQKLLLEINNVIPGNIDFENRSIKFEELEEFRGIVRNVLITYKPESVLSSAILMDSLSFGFSVIAPDTASFSELKEEKKVDVKTYTSFFEIPYLLEMPSKDIDYTSFLDDNNWVNFTTFMMRIIN